MASRKQGYLLKQKEQTLHQTAWPSAGQRSKSSPETQKNQSDFKFWKGTFSTEHSFASVETYEILTSIHYTPMHLYTPLLSSVQMKTVCSE